MALAGPEVDDQLEPRRLFDRDVGRFGPTQQRGELPAQHIPKELDDARPVPDQAALFRPFGPLVHGRQAERRNPVQNDRAVVEEES